MNYFLKCFFDYFAPLTTHIKKVFLVLNGKEDELMISFSLIGVATSFLNKSHLGVSNLLVVLVLLTVLCNTYTGIQKGKFIRKQRNYKGNARVLNVRKLHFVFFKMLSFLFYLFFIKVIFEQPEGWIDNVFVGVLKVPLFLFWYYEFKSIGENTAVYYGKKAPIFTILENILEWRFSKFYKKE